MNILLFRDELSGCLTVAAAAAARVCGDKSDCRLNLESPSLEKRLRDVFGAFVAAGPLTKPS